MREVHSSHKIRVTERKLSAFAALPQLSTQHKAGLASIACAAVLSFGALALVFTAQAKADTSNANEGALNSSTKVTGHSESSAPEPISNSSSSVNVNLNSESHSSSDGQGNESNNSSTSLKVNGQDIPVDQSGNVNQTFNSSDGSSSVKINVNHSSSVSSGGSSM